ncbi:MAG: hypothetical protein ACQESP_12350 [Candidatus Muiribacteriota bacterium]
MAKAFEHLSTKFTNFFTRSVAPSSVFFMLLFFNDLVFNEQQLYETALYHLSEVKNIDEVLLYGVLVLIFLAYGYINQLCTQYLDECMKENYTKEPEFQNLRKKVEAQFSVNEKVVFDAITVHDYNLYQVLGKDTAVPGHHVDEVKALHTVYVAIGANILITVFVLQWGLVSLLCFPVVLFFYYAVGLWFHELAKGRYAARNKRLYINYLLDK